MCLLFVVVVLMWINRNIKPEQMWSSGTENTEKEGATGRHPGSQNPKASLGAESSSYETFKIMSDET